jgi:ABC-2 type transport system ATP-binding protein
MTAPGTPPAIETRRLSRTFGELVALRPLDLVVEPGTIFGLLGPNGAGKSTTIKILTTLLPPSSGTAQVAGYDVIESPALVRRHIGYVPQLLSERTSCCRPGSTGLRGRSAGRG